LYSIEAMVDIMMKGNLRNNERRLLDDARKKES